MADSHRSAAVAAAIALVVVVGGLATWGAWVRREPDPERIRREAEADLEGARYERAATALARLRDPSPHDRLMRAEAARALGHPDQAIDELALVPAGDPSAAQALLMTGQIELGRDRVRRAEEALRAALKLDPDLVPAYRQLIYVDGMLLRRRELNEHFQALQRLGPLTFDNVFHWCLIRSAVWEPHERVEDLQRFVAADPSDRASRVALAETLRQLGRREEATKVLSVLPESDPDARAVRARIALDRGEESSAEAILAGGPDDHPELARLRGRFALAHGDARAAVRHFRAAYAVEPDDRDTVFGLGTALALVGEKDAAAPFLRESKALDTLGALIPRAANPANRGDAALLRALGAACEAARRIPEARAWYGLAVEADPLDSQAQKALYRLKAR
jgi:tetratricopeptide (TPR) repeat protein